MADQVDLIAQAYNQKYDRPISISVVDKARDWRGRQEIQYNAVIGNISKDFHGVNDFKKQMALYSATNHILRTAWYVIIAMVLSNAEVLLKMFTDKIMGPVGSLLKSLNGFDQVFAVSPEELKIPSGIAAKAATFASAAESLGTAQPLPKGPTPQKTVVI